MSILSFVGARGTTAERVGFSTAPTGFHFYDTTLGVEYIWDGAAWVGVSTTISPALVYDVDFSALGAQDFKAGGDGNYTVDGKTWTIANTANASIFNIAANGVGGTAVAPGGLSGPATSTLMMMYAQLTQFFPALQPGARVRARVYQNVSDIGGSYEAFYLAIGLTKASFFTLDHYYGKVGTAAGHQVAGYGAGTIQNVNQATNLADDVLMIDIPCLGGRFHTGYSGVYAAGWPALSAMRCRAEISILASGAVFNNTMQLATDSYVYLMGQYSPTVPNFKWRITRMRLEAWL